MKTRRILAAEINKLQAQLAATGHETRKGMKARIRGLEDRTKSLMDTEAKVRSELNSAKETIGRLQTEIADLRQAVQA